jgi:NAD(P)-dependent dehydrogenase (short-subunit alcohol dehydrogenase family)
MDGSGRYGVDFKGRAALVTGVAGEIGRATALRLAALGADLCLVDEDAVLLEALATDARASGVRAVTHAADVARAENCRAAVAAAVAAFGRLDALCNLANAFYPARAAEMASDDFERTLAVNMAAPFFLFQAAIPHLLASNGAVVNVSSAAGVIATPNTAAYSASKAGLDHLTRVLAKEYMDSSVRINAVAPGSVAAGLIPQTQRPSGVDPKTMQRGLAARGFITAEDIADVVAYLASDAAHAYHGAVIAFDKGLSLG